MKTIHKIIYDDSINLVPRLPKDSVDLVVTSPPYPMIEMWDNIWPNEIKRILKKGPHNAFRLIHAYLNNIWLAIHSVLKPGGILCINIGDAVRNIDEFRLYPNSAFIYKNLFEFFTPLPSIIWRKISNSPNKFMGSGPLPVNSYMTLEHEHILIFRKGPIRKFSKEETKRRYHSCLFWEERNAWFSDLWDDTGDRQNFKTSKLDRKSASFPLGIPYKLINMFSIEGDVVLDPFLGTGTTMLAAMIAGRSCIGVEKVRELKKEILTKLLTAKETSKQVRTVRAFWHSKFLQNYKGELKYKHKKYGKIKTKLETRIKWPIYIGRKVKGKNNYICYYK